jgi:Holliday junction resolvasome RuvABC ATP-dependent DNA helicase subunit
MREKEVSIGNYFNLESCPFGHLTDARETMVQMMEEIHRLKGYREETLYIAIGLADKFLKTQAERGL